jgi:hypothetical protein
MARHSLINLSNTEDVRLTPLGTHSGMDLTVQNVNNSGYIYLGGEGVSSENYGYRINASHAFSIELNGKESLYAIASAPSMKIAIIMTNLEHGS